VEGNEFSVIIGTTECYNAHSVQLALAWLLAQVVDIVPILRTQKLHYLEENVKAAVI